ncbi:MAG: DUF2141 domain-containing protein [Spirochaetales bacterium]|nr:DUF2141 domain-containing protein [Spirochaetales bacterium]
MNFEQMIEQKKYYIVWIGIFVAGAVLLFIGITNNNIWYDEAFTGCLVRHSFVDIVKISAGDNHPPLYFLITKIITFIFGNNAFSLRTASLLGVLALAALGLSPVKRIFGKKASMLFTFITVITPAFVGQALNARMYTWAAFFTTACVLYAYLAVTGGKRKDWIIFGIVTVLGLYTHVYLMLECLIVYAAVFVWLFFKDRKKLIPYFIIAASVIVLYLPWIFVVLSQASEVAKDFWIPAPTSPWILWGTLFIPFQHEFGSTMSHIFVNIACLLSGALTVMGIINAVKHRKKAGNLVFLSIIVAVATFAGVFILSYLVRPILMPRYFTSVIGLYIIVWMYGILILKQDVLKIISAVLLLALFIPQIIDIKTVQRNGPIAEIRAYLQDKVGPDDVFLHSDEHQFGIFTYYYPEHKHYLLLKQGFSGFGNYEAFAPNGVAGHYFGNFIKGKSRVWLVNRFKNNFPQFPVIPGRELEESAHLYKAALPRRFSQDNSFLHLEIAEYSADPADKLDESALFQGNIKELKITVNGFKNNQGKANISIYSRELYELSVDYFWQNTLPEQIEQAVFDKLFNNNNFLTDEDKKYLLSFYTLDENDGIYKLTKQPVESDKDKFNAIYEKLLHSKSEDITAQQAEFIFNDLPKDMYYIFVFHDENGDGLLDMRENAPPAEGMAVSNADNGLQGEPTFDSNYIVLDQEQMEESLTMYYY